MPGSGRVNHAVGEAEFDEAPRGARVAVQRVHLLRDEMGDVRLLGHDPAGDAAFGPAATLAAAHRKRPTGELRDRSRDRRRHGRQSHADSSDYPLGHGHATMAALAILNPKLVPGVRLVKKDSVNFCLSP